MTVVGKPSASQLVVRQLLTNFVIYNPLYLFSATLILGGTWLLNPPDAGGGRDLTLLLQLFCAIQLYEFTLLGAAALLARRGDLKRDVRNLSFVLAPFLVDMTFTTAALTVKTESSLGLLPATLLGGGVLALTSLKIALSSRLIGRRFSPYEWLCLLGGPLLVTCYPFAASALAGHSLYGAWVPLLGGLLLGGIGLLFARQSVLAPESGSLRQVALIPLLVGLLHVGGTTWSMSGELLLVLGPCAILLSAALPQLAWPRLAAQDQITPLVLSALGVLLCGLGGGEVWGISSWNLGLAGTACVQSLMFWRHRSLRFAAGALLAVHMHVGGATLRESLTAFGSNPLEPIALLAFFGWGVQRRLPLRTLAAPLLLAGFLVGRLEPWGVPALDGVTALQIIGMGLLIWTHCLQACASSGARARLIGATLLYFPAAWVALAGNPFAGHLPAADPLSAWGGLTQVATGHAMLAIVGLLALGWVTRLRVYWLPTVLIPAVATVRLAPTTSSGWGALGISLAFAAVSLGVVVSLQRQRLLAWLGAQVEREGLPAQETSRAETP